MAHTTQTENKVRCPLLGAPVPGFCLCCVFPCSLLFLHLTLLTSYFCFSNTNKTKNKRKSSRGTGAGFCLCCVCPYSLLFLRSKIGLAMATEGDHSGRPQNYYTCKNWLRSERAGGALVTEAHRQNSRESHRETTAGDHGRPRETSPATGFCT